MIELAGGRTRPMGRRPLRVLSFLAVFLLAFGGTALGGRAVLHRGEALPGVRVLGDEVSGVGAAQVGLRIRAVTAARLAQPVELAAAGTTVTVVPRKLFTLDRQASARAVLRVGRESWPARVRALLSPLTPAREVDPVLVPRAGARRRLTALLGGFGRPAVPAGASMRGLEPAVTVAQAGTRPDLDSLLAALADRVIAGRGTVTVEFESAPPPVSDAAAATAAEEARLVVSSPIALTLEGRPVGKLTPERMARLLRFRPRTGRLLVLIDEKRLAQVLDPRIARFEKRAVNARFQVNGKVAWIVPSKPGLGLDVQGAVVAVTTAGHQRGERTADLALVPVEPDLTSGEAQALGIRERISSFTTEMGVSSSNRIHNVHLMADYIEGTIVRPGETFAFNRVVGPRTVERGFREGQMIIGSLLLPSIGGGVCQTATTLFNNAFELGLPILKRRNHSFYISHYPLGRDATVSWGGPEFAFRNDMANALLIKARYSAETLTFSFYGTREGRLVTSRTGPKRNWKQPKLTYALDPLAPRGSMRVVNGSNQAGFDVTVYRVVRKGSKILRRDAFESSYIAVGPTAIYGPGRRIPGSYFVIPPT